MLFFAFQNTLAQNDSTIKFEIDDKTSLVKTSISAKNCHMTFQDDAIYVSGLLVKDNIARNITMTIEGGAVIWSESTGEKPRVGKKPWGQEITTNEFSPLRLKEACSKVLEQLPSHLHAKIQSAMELPDATTESVLLSKVALYDALTLAALHNPDPVTKETLLSLVEHGSPAYNDYLRMAPRYANDETRLNAKSWHQINSTKYIGNGPKTAKVVVRESAYWESYDGRIRYDRVDVLHTYTLNLINGEWKIAKDEF